MKEKIKNILIEEFSKINNINYKLEIHNLKLKINTKRIILSLINHSSSFEAGINSKWRLNHYKNSSFWFSYKHIWSKFEKESGLKYDEIQSLVKSILEEGFKLKNITSVHEGEYVIPDLEEGFKLKGVTPVAHSFMNADYLEEGFKLKNVTPHSLTRITRHILEEGFKLKNVTPRYSPSNGIVCLEEGFKLKNVTSVKNIIK